MVGRANEDDCSKCYILILWPFEAFLSQLSDSVGNIHRFIAAMMTWKLFVCLRVRKSLSKSCSRKDDPIKLKPLISRRLCKYPLQHNHLPLKFSHIVKIYSSVFLFQYELYHGSVGWTWWVKKWFTFIKKSVAVAKIYNRQI